MQSLFRAMKRGNTIAYFVSESNGVQIMNKKGSTPVAWRIALKHDVTKQYLQRYAPSCI